MKNALAKVEPFHRAKMSTAGCRVLLAFIATSAKLRVDSWVKRVTGNYAAPVQFRRELVADESPAAAGEDGRPAGEAARYCWLLLAESGLTRRLFGAMVRRIA